MISARGVPLSIAVVTGYDLSQTLIPTFQSWINAGWDVVSHSVSHQYFVFPNAFTLQYTGLSTSATLNIAKPQLTITAPGDANGYVTWDLTSSGTDLTPSGLDTLGGMIATLKQRGVFNIGARGATVIDECMRPCGCRRFVRMQESCSGEGDNA